jgi:hypothetical protein
MATADSHLKHEDKFFNFNKELMEDLEKHLICTTCKKVPRNATVSWCSKHHLMCESCYETKRYCGLLIKCRNCGYDITTDYFCLNQNCSLSLACQNCGSGDQETR